jgi:dolichyl-phosphate-mannose--protein O-mannosyl transferase
MKNNLLKSLLIVQSAAVLIYTFFAFKNEGANLIGVFLANIQSLSWNGQFNLDFLCYLVLSGLWIMWRNKFSSKSIFVGFIAMILGIIFFAPYILWLLHKENGDLKQVLVGDR